MDLEQRPGPEALCCQPLIQPDHRDLHDIRRGSLDRHVDRHPLPRSAKGRIGRAQLRDLAAASQEGRDEPIPPRGLLDVEHVVADPGVRGEVRADEFLRLLAADAGPAGQTEVAHPVGEAEVDHLGHRSLVAGDLIGRLVEHAGRRLSMNVGLARECRSQVLVAGHVGDDPELDLRVVRRHQDEIGAAGHERPPDSSTEWRPDRDVLEVRVGRGQASGRGHGLVERGVDTAVVGDERRQRLDVGGSKLRVGAPVENRLDGRVDVHELLEDRRVGRVAGLGLAALGQLQLAEQHVAQLLRGADGEFVADGVEDRSLEPGDLGCELALTLPYPTGASIAVNVEGERAISLDAKVKDLLIVGLGDSFASGEGNPDVPVVMSERFRHRNTLPRRARNDAGGNAQWVDELCHRSLYGHQLRAALQIAIENVQSAVTFLGYSCSGASVEEGLLGPQTHMNYVSSGDGDASAIKSVKGGARDAQLFWLLRDLCKEKPQRDDGFFLCPENQFRRDVDLLLLSAGGNDIGFSELVTWATLRDNTSSTIASFLGATVSPKQFAENMKDNLPSAYAQLAKALEIAVPLRLADNVFDPSRVVLSAYPDILEDESGQVCASGEEGDNEGSFAANQSLDAFAGWLVVTPGRLGKAHGQLGDLHKRMGELALDHGWSFAGQAYEGRAFQGHGFCARNVKAKGDPAEQLAIPCWSPPDDTSATCTGSWSGGERRWRPYNPESESYPYALRQRWVRTFNDAYLLVNQKVTTPAGQIDGRASDAVFAETTGAMHPTAEGHAAMADAMLLDLRATVKNLLAPANE